MKNAILLRRPAHITPDIPAARATRVGGLCSGAAILAVCLLALAGCLSAPHPPTVTPEAAPTHTPSVATETPTDVVLTASATPSSPPTATIVAPRTPARPAPTPTASAALSVTLIWPPTPAVTTTAQPVWPTPVWPGSPLDRTDNILVMGVDYRPGDAGWRTDTLMVVAIDAPASRVGIISIPRDLYVDIPGYGMGRINQADFIGESSSYAGGGQALLRRVISETLGISTRHYVRIRMEGLVRLVDALGGVTVVLDCPLYERTPNDASPNGVEDWSLPAGPVLLDGETAKKFATYRYATTDFGRARRQQQLIWAIRDRALQVDILPRIPEMWQAFADMFVTDLSLLDIVRLAGFGIGLKPENVHGAVLDSDVLDYYITPEGAWVLVIADYNGIAARKAQIFDERPLATFNVGDAQGGCPPPPTPPPTFTPPPTAGADAAPSAPRATPTPTPPPS